MTLIQSFSSKPPEAGADAGEPRPPGEAGMNRFVWNMRYPAARKVPEDKTTEDAVVGPLASPGAYQVSLQVGDDLPDPNLPHRQGSSRGAPARRIWTLSSSS